MHTRQQRIRWIAWMTVALGVLALGALNGCAGRSSTPTLPAQGAHQAITPGENSATTATPLPSVVADVISVEVSGSSGAYQLAVEVTSPDTGCEQYADWWEVLDEQGRLLYRRVLTHSHANEQPFVRSGGPVPIDPGTMVWVRAHMHSGGYGGAAFKGSVESGFAVAELAADFAAEVVDQPPLPDGCAF